MTLFVKLNSALQETCCYVRPLIVQKRQIQTDECPVRLELLQSQFSLPDKVAAADLDKCAELSHSLP